MRTPLSPATNIAITHEFQSSYDFTIPTYAPSGEALFAWSWQNKVGNREFYMDCAVVQVQGNSHYKRQGPHDNMDSLPGIWKADLQSITDCTTVEGESPVYPHPGSDVEYGDGLDSSSPPTPGDCDATSPSPQSTNSSSSDPYTDYNPTNVAAQSHGPPSPSAGSPHDSGLDLVLKNKAQGSAAVSSGVDGADSAPYPADGPTMFAANPVEPTSTASTTTIYIDCPETITMTIYPSETLPTSSTPPVYTTSVPPSACIGTSASCPCAPGYDSRCGEQEVHVCA